MVEVKNDFMKLFWEKNLKECWTKEYIHSNYLSDSIKQTRGVHFWGQLCRKMPLHLKKCLTLDEAENGCLTAQLYYYSQHENCHLALNRSRSVSYSWDCLWSTKLLPQTTSPTKLLIQLTKSSQSKNYFFLGQQQEPVRSRQKSRPLFYAVSKSQVTTCKSTLAFQTSPIYTHRQTLHTYYMSEVIFVA